MPNESAIRRGLSRFCPYSHRTSVRKFETRSRISAFVDHSIVSSLACSDDAASLRLDYRKNSESPSIVDRFADKLVCCIRRYPPVARIRFRPYHSQGSNRIEKGCHRKELYHRREKTMIGQRSMDRNGLEAIEKREECERNIRQIRIDEPMRTTLVRFPGPRIWLSRGSADETDDTRR